MLQSGDGRGGKRKRSTDLSISNDSSATSTSGDFPLFQDSLFLSSAGASGLATSDPSVKEQSGSGASVLERTHLSSGVHMKLEPGAGDGGRDAVHLGQQGDRRLAPAVASLSGAPSSTSDPTAAGTSESVVSRSRSRSTSTCDSGKANSATLKNSAAGSSSGSLKRSSAVTGSAPLQSGPQLSTAALLRGPVPPLRNQPLPSCCAHPLLATPHHCAHLQLFKERPEHVDALRAVLQLHFALSQRLLIMAQQCFHCGSSGPRLHACLHCVYFVCPKHIAAHLDSSGHQLALDLDHLQLFCGPCHEYVYDTDVDLLAERERSSALNARRQLLLGTSTSSSKSKRDRATYSVWNPTAKEEKLLQNYSEPYRVPQHLCGLRGLVNLGNTCFMNCILQCFIHNPLVRNFFLSDLHNRTLCTRRTATQTSGDSSPVCLACEMDQLFEEAFSGNHVPFTPHTFLYSMWRYSNWFAGYEQKDAHEFFINTLNGVHNHIGGTPSDCSCVIHRTFGGKLRSDVVCTACSTVSTAMDPCFDVSLDIVQKAQVDLVDCLREFTTAENLHNDEKFHCSKCKSLQDSTKQLSLNCLPPVLCFHLKRFEQQSNNRRYSTKIDTYVRFPLLLDMKVFTSPSIVGRRTGQEYDQTAELYELFSVVCHQGEIDKGHYTTYVKQAGSWMRCDDSWITKASAEEVLRSAAYMLFYVRTTLCYDDDYFQ